VGDAAFQKKCLGKMGEAANKGRTVLFISHNMLAVDSLCSRAICLHDGKIVMEGQPRKVISGYLQNWITASTELIYPDIASAPGNDQLRLHRACVRPLNGSPGDQITVRTPVEVEFEYWKLFAGGSLELGVNVNNEQGILLFSTGWPGDRPVPEGLLRSSFVVPGDLLNTGTHRIALAMEGAGGVAELYWEDLLVFDVLDTSDLRGLYHRDWPGAVRPQIEWKTEQVAPLSLGSAMGVSAGKNHS